MGKRSFADEGREGMLVRQWKSPGSGKPIDAPIEQYRKLTDVADGLSNEAIADELVLSVRTVERHLSNSYAKLRVSGKAARAAAAARYVRATRHPVR